MNGLANRFLFFAVKRSKLLPDGASLDPNDKKMMIDELRQSLSFAQNCGEIKKDSKAKEYWNVLYRELAEGESGVVGSLSSRSEAQIMRMALIHALIARRSEITELDIQTAASIHQYSIDSLKYLFGERTGFQLADNIFEFIKLNPSGVNKTQIHDKFSRNLTKDNLSHALDVLIDSKLLIIEPRYHFGKTVDFYLPAKSTSFDDLSVSDEFYEQGTSFNSYLGASNE
jgi:hypothetical protein